MILELDPPIMIFDYRGVTLSDVIKTHSLPCDTKEVVIYHLDYTLIIGEKGNEFKKAPKLFARAKGLGETLVDTAKNAIKGKLVVAPDNVVNYRLGLCKACPYYDKVAFCRSCGCVTEAKVRLAASRCPEGKWPSIS